MDALIDGVAAAVVARLEERRKIAAIAEYVIAEMERRQESRANPGSDDAEAGEEPGRPEEERSGKQ
jgi:hypothetical protein